MRTYDDFLYWNAPTSAHVDAAFRERELYGEPVPSTELRSPESIREFWIDEWRRQASEDMDNVIMWSGPPGSGKSMCALYVGQLFDPDTFEQELEERVIFKSLQLFDLFKKYPEGEGKFAFLDEAASVHLLATQTYDPEQLAIVEALNIMRAAHWTLGIVVQDPDLLAKSIRVRRADYHVQTRDRRYHEPQASIGRRLRGPKYFSDRGSWLGFVEDPEMNPFTWPDLRGTPIWKRYYPMKKANQASRNNIWRQRVLEIQRREEGEAES